MAGGGGELRCVSLSSSILDFRVWVLAVVRIGWMRTWMKGWRDSALAVWGRMTGKNGSGERRKRPCERKLSEPVRE